MNIMLSDLKKEIGKFQFIEQKAPADLEKSAGVFYLFTAEQNKLTYL